MSVTLSPVAPRYAVSDADDPFKKYWWLILLGIAFTGIWLLAPMAGEKSIGSTSIDTSKPKIDPNNIEQAASDEGDGVYLSMDGTGHKRKEDPLFGSSLYQALPEDPAVSTAGATAAALGSASGAASGSTLAGALKKVSESGGWSEKAQKGFNAPKLSGTSLGGLGSASGGSAGSSGFGSKNANIGFANARGLSDGGGEAAGPNSKGIEALRSAAALSVLASANKSNDGARSDSARPFDGGGKGGNKVGGPAAGGVPANYAALDAAPVNLKLDDPKLNDKKIEAPPPADIGAASTTGSDIGKQIVMAMAAAAVGAAIGGPVGGMAAQVMMKAIERQSQQEDKIREMEQKQEMDRAARRMGSKPS